MPSLSVIIATHKRAPILHECLRHLEQQTIADQLEVIVVSDGPHTETEALFEDPKTYTLNPITFLSIPKSHQGVARNRGVQEASSDLVLFINDDIFLAPDACQHHLSTHKNPTSYKLPIRQAQGRPATSSVLGHITWDPSLNITLAMRWLEQSGWQFAYPLLEPFAGKKVPRALQHRVTYASHISVPLTVAKAHPFREDVTLYGWEDVLWGEDLRNANIPLIYQPAAKAFHHHRLTLEDSLKRMETLGRSAVIMARLDPRFDRLPRGPKRWAYQLLSLLPTLRGKHAEAFLRGIDGEMKNEE